LDWTEDLEEDGTGSFEFFVNGEPIYIRGTNWKPLDPLASLADQKLKTGKALQEIKNLNCNMVRIWGGGIYEDSCFFDFCDRNGIMVWQDFMFACEFPAVDDDYCDLVAREAAYIVKKYRNHPSLAVWCGDNDGRLYQYLYDAYYNVEKWRDCFVYWNDKPFLLTTHTRPENFPLKDQDLYTVRSMWGLGVDFAGGQWSYLNVYNYGRVTNGADGKPEQVGVAVAAQETYMSEPTAHGRKGGTFWYCQWYYAFEVHPKIVTLTWWNEWTVQRIEISPGRYIFTDNYNREYSRDIEPMEGGHGDQYYQWLKQYISYYKAGLDCPVLVEEKFVDKVDRFLQTAMRS
jgi:hypothetical protein